MTKTTPESLKITDDPLISNASITDDNSIDVFAIDNLNEEIQQLKRQNKALLAEIEAGKGIIQMLADSKHSIEENIKGFKDSVISIINNLKNVSSGAANAGARNIEELIKMFFN